MNALLNTAGKSQMVYWSSNIIHSEWKENTSDNSTKDRLEFRANRGWSGLWSSWWVRTSIETFWI